MFLLRIIERPSVQAVLAEDDDEGEDTEISHCKATSGHVTSHLTRGRALFFTNFLTSSKEMLADGGKAGVTGSLLS